MSIIEGLQDFVGDALALLTPVEASWQPTDLLPDLAGEGWRERLGAFREEASRLPAELLVVLVGNMVTEEALPNYAIALQRVARDATGTSETPWARWLRGWTAEENRHGDLLNAYLRLTGRVEMREVERTVQHLIRNGFSQGNEGDDYASLAYAAFQERATRLTHAKLGRLAAANGEGNLARICRKISADEARHEVFYTRVVGEVFERDPEGMILSYHATLRKLIAMPGARMADGRAPGLFEDYSAAVLRAGVYTTHDYAAVIRHLNTAWGVERRSLAGKAARAQDYICRQPERYELLAAEIECRALERAPARFSWLVDGLDR
ncbi:acyl-ACP desaturase [Aquisphaera insulae]|uniref:acyl-ACP desaturase n=1 Tax=Aquisphaera insulae TaxID=2712864 RepID=UPI0013EA3D5B|nr:acyl-ACP desaturase [Aquisphaera insulae]